ncbi:UDP-glucosyltransferase 2-like [Periplaneta americana]|uniref:UDP-glucosyltransferase 2-like n=1 Tax=Periplaneta americana TaxID=6978 RepID=UPI0037E93193
MEKNTYLIHCIVFMTSAVLGARILGVFPTPSKSHQMIHRSLMRGLQLRGHEIVIITTDPLWDTSVQNYTEIDISAAQDLWAKRYNFAAMKEKNFKLTGFVLDLLDFALDLCRMMFNTPGVQRLLREENKFDVVIVEWLGYPCADGYAYYFSAPLIGIMPFGLEYTGHDSVANPTNPAYTTDINIPFSDRATFWERLKRFSYSLWFRYMWYTTGFSAQHEIAKEYFGKHIPYIGDLHQNVSLLLVNHESKIGYVRPYVPGIVEIAGIHLKEPQPLKAELQNFLDGAPEGVIYFNLGTNIKSDTLAQDKRQMFLDVFSDLTQFRVLWKWDTDELPGQPSNVKVAKWFPQQDLLHHPSIKVFMYHGGLQSTLEAIRASVPLICFPFFGDQYLNVRKIAEEGAGMVMDINNLTKHTMKATLTEVIYNSTYKENMEKLSNRLNDQPEKPLDRAVWWVEYVIKHKGARHLRSAAVDLMWYQYLLLDVIAFISVFIITICATYRIIRIIGLNKIISSLRKKFQDYSSYFRYQQGIEDLGTKTGQVQK